jgi:hypothetical protein
VSNCTACAAAGGRVKPVSRPGGGAMDAVEVVAQYLASLPDSIANPVLGRVRLLRPLPRPRYLFDEIQPLQGARGSVPTDGRAGQKPPPARH